VRLLLLADCLDNGGLERQMSLLATNVPPGWDARVWAMAGGPFEEHLRAAGVPVLVRARRSRFDPLPAARLWGDMGAWRPDVVHAWSWMSMLAAGPVCRCRGIPLIDGTIQTGAYRREFLGLDRIGMAFATLVAANTQAGLDAWGVGAERGRVVYNGFDWSRVPADDQTAPGTRQAEDERADSPAGDCITVVMTARMAPEKHYDIVLAAARRLSRERPGWRFMLVGDGPDRPRLMEAARDLVAAGIVTFPQPGMEVLGLVRTADIGVLMTNPAHAFEGLSNSIMEYMALGLPVVCGDGGGNPELVLHEQTGFIVPPGDAKELARRLALLRDRPDLRREMGAAGRSRILGELSVQTMVDGMIAVYEEALAKPR
jgi:glycosyltransferase involved in cell wall biosynthesis